jgi:hypothetical protein
MWEFIVDRGVGIAAGKWAVIREEKSGTKTLVGVIPGSLSLPQFPTGISKLGIYCRLQFPIDFADFSATTFLQASWGQRVDLGGFGEKMTAQAKRETVALGLPLARNSQRNNNADALSEPGRLELIVKIGEDERVCGALGLVAFQPSASELPSGQSPSDAPKS